jgi:hypothetical protein
MKKRQRGQRLRTSPIRQSGQVAKLGIAGLKGRFAILPHRDELVTLEHVRALQDGD